ncbi:MAG: hypothetical protein SFU57_01060 [Gemmatimonadales bacterium]|nr:hypothetical protein [Gemmatimonadales bacterium]
MNDPAELGGICQAASGIAAISAGIDHTCHSGVAEVQLAVVGPGKNSTTEDELEGSIAQWNALLKQGQTLGMFRLKKDLASGIRVHIEGGTGDLWCGRTFGKSGGIDSVLIRRDQNCGGSRRASRQTILTHELAHVLGWNTGHGPEFAKFSPLTAGICTTFLPRDSAIMAETPVAGSVCHAEVEALFRARLGGGWLPDTVLLASQILTHTDASPRTVTGLATGDTATVAVTRWFSAPNGVTVTNGVGSLAWSSDNSNIAAIVAPGRIRGQSGGTTKIRMRGLSSFAPPGFQLWWPFRHLGDSITVTITAPATNILLDEVPVWTAGYHSLTFVSGGTPGQLVWTIDDSRTTTLSPDTTFTTPGWTAMVHIGAGSYTLTVTAGGIVRQFPVCTASSSQAAMASVPSLPGTDAVANCPPPSGPPEEEF